MGGRPVSASTDLARARSRRVTNGAAAHLPVLTVDNLGIDFDTPRGTIQADCGVSVEVSAGPTTGVVGESGSGTSVGCKSAMGLRHARHACDVHHGRRDALAGR